MKSAAEIVLSLRENHFIVCNDNEDFFDWVETAATIGFAYCYGYREYDSEEQFYKECIVKDNADINDIYRFRDDIERVRHAFEYYDFRFDNDNLWILAAYLWKNKVGFEYVLSIYERDCLGDREYQKIGRIIKESLQKNIPQNIQD